VRAGLLPRLADRVLSVYIEATAEDTVARLLKGLRKRCADLPVGLGLTESVAALRRGQGIAEGHKVLLVLDQFEQWLHAKGQDGNMELVPALRQCDGGRVQGVVMVRDDFWMAATRFMRALEIRLLEGQNSAAVDLHDGDHARKVLAAFGLAFGRLPESPRAASKEQRAFLDQAVTGLAQEGKVISVRLALFAEMMKGKPWTPASLRTVGGTEGVGVTFLEETFSASTAPPEHRYHQQAARAVLKALLPETGSSIKGNMRSHEELRAAVGSGRRAADFDDLLHLLDGELRLITPTDPEGVQGEATQRVATSGSLVGPKEPASEAACGYAKQYYQLTHDYLVPSLRAWLTRKQKETPRGRAELLLADRAGVWNARPENRQLPSLLQWVQIRWLTPKKTWTSPQRKMMRLSRRYHVLRALVVAICLTLLGWGAYECHGRLQAHALRGRLLDANTIEVATIVQDLAPYRPWIDPLLCEAFAQAAQDSDRRKQLHASLALLPVDKAQVEYLYGRLLDAEPHEVPVIRDALANHRSDLMDRLGATVEQPVRGKEPQRLRAAAALAKYDPASERWHKVSGKVVADLVAVNPVYFGLWSEAFRPVKAPLLAPLSVVFRERQPERTAERSLATNLLADYAADEPNVLADLLMDGDEKQFAVLYPLVAVSNSLATPQATPLVATLLTDAVDRKPAPEASEEDKEQLAKRQANAAVTLLRLGHPERAWPLLKHSPDPRARSYLIHRFGPLGPKQAKASAKSAAA
jgi:hypothetical protein